MQQRVAWMLNSLFIVMCLVIVALWAGYFFITRQAPSISGYYLVGAILASVALTVVFLWLEQNWDKRVILKMVQEGKIAIANIKNTNKIKFLRDSSFTKYWMYEFEACIYDSEHNPQDIVFYEKMRFDCESIPSGTVFITYDEAKPEQVFIIPNILISHVPQLQPIVSSYESNSKIKIKYLDVFYNKGLVLRTYKEAVMENTNSYQESED